MRTATPSSSTIGERTLVTAGTSTRRRRGWGIVTRALHEFAGVPLVVIALFVVVAVLSIIGDQTHLPVVDSLRHAASHVVGKQAASSALQAIATGLVTVTSITFSVLLLAVQQTATSLSPVVFDQFVRRRSNQVFLGFFLGLALYAYVVLAAVNQDTPPILGATVATLLTVAALLMLLGLVYSTVDQMRPANVISQIHDRVLAAREREADLVRLTRREIASNDPVSATHHSTQTGYVIGIDIGRLRTALDEIPDAEIELHVGLGSHVGYGDAIATVRDDDEEHARRLADEVRDAVLISRQRDLDYDPSTGVTELGNIAWTSTSTAKHNPAVARQALNALTDIAARWAYDDPARRTDDDTEPLPIVYRDNDLELVLDMHYSMLVAAHESQQHLTAASVLDAYVRLIATDDPGVVARVHRDVTRARALLDEMPASPMLDEARERVRDAIADHRPGQED